MANKKRDDEKRNWLIVGILFTGLLLGFDFGYSSFSQMAVAAIVAIYIAHAVLVYCWAVVMLRFNDPNYDVYRKYVVGLAVVLTLVIGIHHAVVKEDKQVIKDAKESQR